MELTEMDHSKVLARAAAVAPARSIISRLSTASMQTVKELGDGDLGEFAIFVAALAFLHWKYFGNPRIAFKTPPLAEEPDCGASEVALIIEVRPTDPIGDYLARVARIVESGYAEAGLGIAHLTTIGLTDEDLHQPLEESDEDLQLLIRRQRGEVEIRHSARLEPVLLDSFAASFAELLAEFGRLSRPLALVQTLPREQLRALEAFNQTTTPAFEHPTVVALFEAQVARTPHAPALVSDSSLVTYADLNERANRLAQHLSGAHRIGPDTLVGIFLERSEWMIIAVLGVLKAGGAFVPIDPDYPRERIDYILHDTQLPVLLTQSDLLSRVLGFSGIRIPLDVELPTWAKAPVNPPPALAADQLAYVLYTSGSTGQPKGCLLEHGNLLNYIAWAVGYYFPEANTGSFGLYSSLCFDFTLTHVFCPLVRGRSLRIFPQSHSIETILQRAFQAGCGIDTLKLTPSHILMLQYLNVGRSGIRKVIVGGEELTTRHISILRKIDPGIEIYNEYGPTEATVGCIVKRIEDESAPVLIGQPIANTRVYILDEAGLRVPFGVRGEIHVAGRGLARGYLRRPQITAERFLEGRFESSERIYRTGDIGCWLPDGQIQSFGRLDGQVKIRGYRIETGEIEAVLAAHPAIEAAAILVRENKDGARKLVACVKGAAELTQGAIRSFLADKLPEYMVPQEVHVLSELPLNHNGKLDRARLAVLTSSQEAAATLPTGLDPIQTKVAELWSEVLPVRTIASSSRFFDLGGDSLAAVQLISRIWETFAVDLGIDELFELQTVAALAARIEAAPGGNAAANSRITPLPRKGTSPVSFGQQRLWFLAQLEEPSAAYNVSSAFSFTGPLDLERLQSAISAIVDRHEILRTSFPTAGGSPVQSIAPPEPVSLEVIDVPTQTHALELAAERSGVPFDLATSPLFRMALYRIDASRHVLSVVLHHIICDAWSARVLREELIALYQKQPVPALDIQYADYAAWQRQHLNTPAARDQLGRLSAALRDAPEFLELPTDQPRPALQTFNGAALPFDLDGPLTQSLRALGRQSDVTAFMILLAGYAALLSRYSRQKDLVIGSPIANRSRRETEPLIGFFVNTLALRIDLTGHPSLRELLTRVKRVALESYASQDIPFEQVVDAVSPERSLSLSPIFQVMFSYETDLANTTSFADLEVQSLPLETQTAKFDLTLYIEDRPDGISGTLEYNTDLFGRETAERMVDHYRNLLGAMIAQPEAPLERLPLLSPQEHQRLTTTWNATDIEYPDTPIPILFEQQAELHPDAIAVVYENTSLKYSELNNRANQLAHQLIDKGVTADSLVCISMERSLEMIVGLLAILKAGGAYVPIDPEYPTERVRFMLENSRSRWLLTQPHLIERLPASQARTVLVTPAATFESGELVGNPSARMGPANLAYMIYTSGSTGLPKGALNTHRAITNRLLWMQSEYGLTTEDRVLQKTPFSFDVSVWEFFWPLITGARLVFARPGGQRESDYLIDLIQQQSITTAHFVPSMLRAFLDAPDVERCKSLRRVICSGEALAHDLQEKFFARLPAGLHNLYGPTEAAVDVTFWECRRNDPHPIVPIGRPIANTRIYIVDEFLQPCPIGIPGELLIAGVAVGLGYHHEPELTAAKFIRDPFSDDPTAHVFRTGDLARYRADGNIEFLGRLDHQIKLRGLRVEPQEIEATLRRHPSVEDCVVLATQAPQTRLVAYVVGASGSEPALREFLRQRLPEFMVPAVFIVLEQLPLLPNGKLDRQALPEPAMTTTTRVRAPARNERERLLVGIWQDVLQLPEVGIHDNFFASGGDSILSIQIVARAGEAGLHLTTRQFFQRQTIAELAAAVEEPAAATSDVSRLGDAPLSPIQHWFFEQDLPDPARFTQTTLLTVPHDTDPARLAEAFEQVHAHHEALRLRFRPAADGWIQEFTAHGNTRGIFAVQDLTATEMPAAAEAAQATLDIVDGPLLAARLFRLGSTARLFIAVHHLAIDGVSWRILLEDLYNAYRGQRLPDKSTSLREWLLHLSSLSGTAAILEEAPFWIGRLTRAVDRVPLDYPRSRQVRSFADPASVGFELPATETDILVRQLPGNYDVRINELLLTALALAIHSVSGQKNVLIDLESHGRHEADSGLDLSRTVGWFTSLYPVLIEIDGGLIPQALQSIKRQLRSIPQEGFGYPLLRYLSADATLRKQLAALPSADILFNYHGRVDSSMSASSSWRLADEDITAVDSTSTRCTHPIEIIAAVVDGKLRVDWRYSKQLHTAASSEAFARQFEHQLRALVYSRPALARSHSAPTQYELSPLQHGILFHALYDHNPLVYLQQTSFTVAGELDTAALRQAWTRAVQRHAVLRTAFQCESLERPVQIIAPHVDLPWQTLDWSAIDSQQRKQAYEEFLIRDRQRGFDLQHAPLLRCTLIREASGLHHFCWSTHHILLDGWSNALLLGEIFQDYMSLARSGSPASIPPPEHSYRDYVEWLGRRDRAADESYWRSQLHGFSQPTPLPGKSPTAATGSEPEGENLEETLQLDEALTTQIQAQVREHHLTLNVLLRGIWAILLARHSGTRDILFGVTVSGRAASLPGIESLVGLFINTLPLRLRLVPERPLLDWLHDIHAAQDNMEPHTYAALADIQKWSDIPRGTALFQTQLVFQNFPVFEPEDDTARETGLEIRDVRSYTHSSYPLVLTVVPGTQLGLKLSYDQRRFTTDSIRSILTQLGALLESVASDPTQQCGKLVALAPATTATEAARVAPSMPTPGAGGFAALSRTSPALAPSDPGTGPALERVLLEIWESALGRQGIKLTDNFFDLGGDSLVALRLMTRVGKTLNRRLPISILVRNPDIEKLAAALRDAPVPERSNGLVQIRAGGRAAPLFLLPGAGGNVACFHPLARRLADIRPVYALEAVGLDGSQPPLHSVEEIAARHIETLWPVAGAGPYYLGGHSFGAAVALEMSHQLIARGATVAKLAILDSFAPVVTAEHAYWHDWDDIEWLLAISHDLGTFLGTDLGLTREDLVKRDPEDQLTQLVKRVMNRDGWLAGAEIERLRAYLSVYQANFRTMYTASMPPLPVSIVLYTSSDTDPRDHEPSHEFAALLSDPTRGWERLSQRPVEVVAVPGTHLSLLVEPHVGTLAAFLDEFLQKADG